MDRKIARVGDRAQGICYHPSHDSPISTGGTIITGSNKCYDEGKKIARVGDKVLTDCGHMGTIISGADKNYDEDKKIARVGDKVSNVFVATIITGSNKTYSG